jgi:SAM-dependent methyltransferase
MKFAHAAEDYDRGRPGWPLRAIDAAVAALDLPLAATVVDLGAGTGQLTRLLAGRFRHVVAVEPLAPMRQLLVANLPHVDVRAGSAEHLPLPDSSAQAIFSAEAFHWFDAPAALAEAARVLQPTGGIALLWNFPAGPWDPPVPDEVHAMVGEAISRGGEPGHPRQQRGAWRQAFDGSAFGDLHQEQVEHVLELGREGLIANALSTSSIAGLPSDERSSLRKRLRDALPPARYRRRLRTDLYWARLRPDVGATADP